MTETPAAPAPTEADAAPTEAAPAAGGVPEVCASDPFGCAKVDPGTTVKVGMGAPMTGGDASFGIDISQGAQIAVKDAGEFEGLIPSNSLPRMMVAMLKAAPQSPTSWLPIRLLSPSPDTSFRCNRGCHADL